MDENNVETVAEELADLLKDKQTRLASLKEEQQRLAKSFELDLKDVANNYTEDIKNIDINIDKNVESLTGFEEQQISIVNDQFMSGKLNAKDLELKLKPIEENIEYIKKRITDLETKRESLLNKRIMECTAIFKRFQEYTKSIDDLNAEIEETKKRIGEGV